MKAEKSLISYYENEYNKISIQVVDINITDSTSGMAADFLKLLKKHMKKIVDERKNKVDVLKAQIAAIEKPYKELEIKYKKLDRDLRSNLTEYQLEKTKRDEERLSSIKNARLNKLEEEKESLSWAKATGADVKANIRDVEAKIWDVENKELYSRNKGEEASSHIRTSWDYEIADEDLVPRPYCSPDKGKIRRAIRGGMRSMMGLRIFEKKGVMIK